MLPIQVVFVLRSQFEAIILLLIKLTLFYCIGQEQINCNYINLNGKYCLVKTNSTPSRNQLVTSVNIYVYMCLSICWELHYIYILIWHTFTRLNSLSYSLPITHSLLLLHSLSLYNSKQRYNIFKWAHISWQTLLSGYYKMLLTTRKHGLSFLKKYINITNDFFKLEKKGWLGFLVLHFLQYVYFIRLNKKIKL